MSQRSAFHRATVFELSQRELEVAKSLGRMESIGQIAQRLGVRPQAISSTIIRINGKLGLYNRFQLAEYVKGMGWV